MLVFAFIRCDDDSNDVCDCKITREESFNMIPISAILDSLVICENGITYKTGGIEGIPWGEYTRLEKLQLPMVNNGLGVIFDCTTDSIIGKGVLYPYYGINYSQKELILRKSFKADLYDTVLNRWVNNVSIPYSSYRIAARNNKVLLSNEELCFALPKMGKETLSMIKHEYDSILKYLRPINDHLIKSLFMGALNSDASIEKGFLELGDQIDKHTNQYIRDRLKTSYTKYTQLYPLLKVEVQNGSLEYFDYETIIYFQILKEGRDPKTRKKFR
ncbi:MULTISPECIES: hypothetical protein [Flavobacteriaceae]|uniref:hypothetical protein n=1 Tax=Flavobacteriaceae TaxID=49546 RepID=UPI001492BB22|nr:MULTISPECIES: hypothetical protein [Allomuricauda]MDC6364826.1 hypothetical protein [Muricauda sp. AC10]